MIYYNANHVLLSRNLYQYSLGLIVQNFPINAKKTLFKSAFTIKNQASLDKAYFIMSNQIY